MRLPVASQSTVCAVASCPSFYSFCERPLPVSLQFVRLPLNCSSFYRFWGFPISDVRQSTVCVGCRLSISLQFVRLSVARLSTVCAIGVVRESTICVGCPLSISLQFVRLSVARLSIVCAVVHCPLPVSLQFVRLSIARQSTVWAVTCASYLFCYFGASQLFYTYEPTNMRAYIFCCSSAQ